MIKKKLIGFKKKLKTIKILYVLYRKIRRFFNEILFMLYIINTKGLSIFRTDKFHIDNVPKQKVTEIELGFLPEFKNFLELVNWLEANNLKFYEGGHTIYLPPQQPLRDLFYPLFSLYSDGVGLKILKDFKKPDESHYVNREFKKNHPKSYEYVLGRPAVLVRIANYLFLTGLGPKVYDLVEIKIKDKSYTAYVVQHIFGEQPSINEWRVFLNMLEKEFQKKIIMPINRSWRKHMDFRPPDCNRNIIKAKTDNKLYYIDFQAFIFRDEIKYLTQVVNQIKEAVHFGSKHWIRGGKYLYQSIFNNTYGKRDTGLRWSKMRAMLVDNNIDMKGKVIFDVGCNAGMMIHCALADGAFWGIGWDKKSIAEAAQRLLLTLGDTRFDIFGTDIDNDTDFYSYIPNHLRHNNDSILFFLAMRKHIGFPKNLGNFPVRYILYEGHQDETLEDFEKHLNVLKKVVDCSVLSISTYKDGDSTDRPIALLENNLYSENKSRFRERPTIVNNQINVNLFSAIAKDRYPLIRLPGMLFYLKHYLFQGVSLQNTEVLDIGCGTGFISIYAVCMGAKNVTSIDFNANNIKILEEVILDYNLSNIDAHLLKFQEFSSNKKFNLILLHNSINHLDEDASKNIKSETVSREKYISMLRKLRAFCYDDTKVIVVDASRYTIFSFLRLYNPFSPSIEWQKHQSPYVWSRLFETAGFANRQIEWIFFNRFGRIGRILFANSICSFFLQAKFKLTASVKTP